MVLMRLVQEGATAAWMDDGLIMELEELKPLRLDCQGLSAEVQPPLGEPSRGLLGYEGALA